MNTIQKAVFSIGECKREDILNHLQCFRKKIANDTQLKFLNNKKGDNNQFVMSLLIKTNSFLVSNFNISTSREIILMFFLPKVAYDI